MSNETTNWLHSKVLAGDCETHGTPWHSSGVKITADDTTNLYPGAVPLERVRQLFDFPVVKAPVSYTLADGRVIESSKVAVAHGESGDLFGIFADSYEIHQYSTTLIDATAHVVSSTAEGLHIDSAGLLAGGAEAWLSLSTAELVSTPEGVDYWPHIIASTSHNGTLATTYKAVNTMVICDNTRQAALSEKSPTYKIKHSKFSLNRLDSAAQALGLITAQSDDFQAEIARLCKINVTDAQWSDYVKAIAPIADDAGKRATTIAEQNREILSTLYNGDPRCEQWRGTAFGALQSVNVFDLWERGTKGDTNSADRIQREAITGTLLKRDTERMETLFKVLQLA